MRNSSIAPIDLVEELQLRRWARLNHVPSDERAADWHPVILEEMRNKDTELQDADVEVSPYVPLAPRQPIAHGSQPVAAPYFFTTPAPVDELHYT